jgi:hypothetical protein
MTSHLYHPLRTKTSTRLVTIHPGSAPNEIVLSTAQTDFTDRPVFEAISYTWGADLSEKTVLLNDSQICIRQNLYDALNRLRHPQKHRVVWVDAISICQTDPQEKSQQVQMIGDIFKAARRVLAWIGREAGESELIFGAAARVPKLSNHDLKDRQHHIQPHPGAYGPLLVPWARLLSRSYFNRTWIVQELALAREVVIFCGSDCISFDQLLNLLHHWDYSNEAKKMTFDSSGVDKQGRQAWQLIEQRRRHLWNIMDMKAASRTPERPQRRLLQFLRSNEVRYHGIFLTVNRFSLTECVDKRDRIYSMLALEPSPEARQNIPVDYAMSIPELFLQCCLHAMNTPVTERDKNNTRAALVHSLIDCLRLSRTELLEIVNLLHQRIRQAPSGSRAEMYKACAFHLLQTFGLTYKSPIRAEMESMKLREQINRSLDTYTLLSVLNLVHDLIVATSDGAWKAWL